MNKDEHEHLRQALPPAQRVEAQLCDLMRELGEKGIRVLPQQAELAQTFGVSMRTIRAAFSSLQQKERIRSVKGMGTLILPPRQSSRTVLLVIDQAEHPYSQLVCGLAGDMLMARGLLPVMFRSRDLGNAPEDVRAALVIAGSPELPVFLKERRVPCCVINDAVDATFPQTSSLQTVRCNSYLWAFAATEWMLRSGKEEVVYFSSNSDAEWNRAKLRGYQDALQKYNRPYDPELVLTVPDVHTIIHDRCAPLLEAVPRIQARGTNLGYVDMSGSMTYREGEVYRRVSSRLIPMQDIAVGVFENYPLTLMAQIQVTVNLRNIVARAVEILLEEVEPFALCETHDYIKIALEEPDGWRDIPFPLPETLPAATLHRSIG